MPPFVASFSPGNFVARPSEDKDVLDQWAVLDSSVDDDLVRDGLASAFALIRCDEDTRFAILDAIPKRLCRKAGEDNRVDGANSRTSKEGGHGLPCHGKVDRYGVALLHSKGFEDVGNTGNLPKQLSVSDLATLAGFVGLVDDSSLRQTSTDKITL